MDRWLHVDTLILIPWLKVYIFPYGMVQAWVGQKVTPLTL